MVFGSIKKKLESAIEGQPWVSLKRKEKAFEIIKNWRVAKGNALNINLISN